MTVASLNLNELFDECINSLNCYGKCLAKDPANSDASDFEELSQCMMVFCDTRTRYLAAEKFYTDYAREVNVDELNINGIAEMIKTECDKILVDLPFGERNKVYVEFKRSILSRNNSLDDSEVAAISQVISTIDPITRLTMTDPVKNIKCGHVYEKSSILTLIKQKARVRCPIAGCNIDHVNEDDLIPDIALKRYLKNDL